MKKIKLILLKIIPILCCIVCAFSLTVVPISAAINGLPEGEKWPSTTDRFPIYPYFSGAGFYHYNDIYKPLTSVQFYFNISDTVSTVEVTHDTYGTDQRYLNSTINLNQYSVMSSSTLIPNYKYQFGHDVTFTSAPARFYVSLDNFWYIPYTEFCRPGYDVRPILEVDCSFIGLNGEAISVSGDFQYMGQLDKNHFEYEYYATTSKFKLTYWDIISRTFPNFSPEHYVPIYISNLVIDYGSQGTYNRFETIVVTIPAITIEENNGNRINAGSFTYNYLDNTEIPPLDMSWIIRGANGFFNAPMFGAITIGGISFTILAATVAIALIKLLNHLK